MRRSFLLALFLLSSCGAAQDDDLQEGGSIEQLREENAELEQKLANIKEKADNLQTASDNLQHQLQRFDSENWADVVPEVKTAGEEVDDAQGELMEVVD